MDNKTKLALLATYCLGLLIALTAVDSTSKIWVACLFSILILIALVLCDLVMLGEVRNDEYKWTAILTFLATVLFAILLPDTIDGIGIRFISYLGIAISVIAGLTLLYALVRFVMNYFQH